MVITRLPKVGAAFASVLALGCGKARVLTTFLCLALFCLLSSISLRIMPGVSWGRKSKANLSRLPLLCVGGMEVVRLDHELAIARVRARPKLTP